MKPSHVGLVLPQEPGDAHQRARRPEAGDEVGDRRQVREDLRAGAVVVRLGVGRVAVLVQHHPVLVLRREPLRDGDGLVRPARGRRVDDLRAEHLQQLTALHRRVLRHHADQLVTALLGDHGE
jgi:hypothetical protein